MYWLIPALIYFIVLDVFIFLRSWTVVLILAVCGALGMLGFLLFRAPRNSPGSGKPSVLHASTSVSDGSQQPVNLNLPLLFFILEIVIVLGLVVYLFIR